MNRTAFKTALALSGGAARGMAHAGVIQVLESHGMAVDLIVGTSMGAIIGALYAVHRDSRAVVEQMNQLLASDSFQNALAHSTDEPNQYDTHNPFDRFVKQLRRGLYYSRSLSRPGLVRYHDYVGIMEQVIPDIPIEDLATPFAAVAMDISSGDELVITKGSLLQAVLASAAVPGILPPIQFQRRLLVDGGWIDNVPATPAIRLGAHMVIAVDASWEITELYPPPQTALELALRSSDITRLWLNRQRRASADVLLIPKVHDIIWSDFSNADKAFESGRRICEKNLWRIRRKRFRRALATLGGTLHPMRPYRWRHPMVVL